MAPFPLSRVGVSCGGPLDSVSIESSLGELLAIVSDYCDTHTDQQAARRLRRAIDGILLEAQRARLQEAAGSRALRAGVFLSGVGVGVVLGVFVVC